MLIDTPVNKITHEILAAAIEVHRIFGPALFERVYEPCFHYELGVRHLHFETQRVVPILYKGMQFGASYRVDLIVERSSWKRNVWRPCPRFTGHRRSRI